MSDIPRARERLKALLPRLGLSERAEGMNIIRTCMVRERPVRKAPVSSDPITPTLKARIKAYAARYPHTSVAYIASLFDVNPGRVSEILNGKK